MGDESKIIKKFDAILKVIKNNGNTAKSVNVKICGSNINQNRI